MCVCVFFVKPRRPIPEYDLRRGFVDTLFIHPQSETKLTWLNEKWHFLLRHQWPCCEINNAFLFAGTLHLVSNKTQVWTIRHYLLQTDIFINGADSVEAISGQQAPLVHMRSGMRNED